MQLIGAINGTTLVKLLTSTNSIIGSNWMVAVPGDAFIGGGGANFGSITAGNNITIGSQPSDTSTPSNYMINGTVNSASISTYTMQFTDTGISSFSISAGAQLTFTLSQ